MENPRRGLGCCDGVEVKNSSYTNNRGKEMSDINDVNTLLKKIKGLDPQVELFKEQRDRLNDEAKKWVDRRDALNSKHSEIWNEVKLRKNKRDEINEAVKKLKEQLPEITSQIDTKREELAKLRERINELLGMTSQSASAVERQLNKLDWEIQTNPLTPAEENKLIEQIRLLERQKLVHKEATSLKERLTDLRAEIGALTVKNKGIRNQMAELANSSQEYHEKMIEKIAEAKPLKDEADEVHKKYLTCREVSNEAHAKYIETINQIKIANAKIKDIEDVAHNKRLNEMVETVSEAAYQKLKGKKKLTLDEFKLLRQKGLI